MTRMRTMLVMIALLLAACGDPGAAGSGGGLELASRDLQPADAELAAIYNRSCRSCHTVAATGAPLTGDVKGWAERISKGSDVLLESVVSGFGGMPPFGLCMDCDADQFDALIAFMATTGSSQ
jgi:cytochrome c5